MIQTWRLSESRHALFIDNPHVEAAARQVALSHMADYAKGGRLTAVQCAGDYAGPVPHLEAFLPLFTCP
jgi:hypothetical protein